MGAAALFAVLSRGTLWMQLRQQVGLSALTELGASASGAAVAIVWHANPLLIALFAAPFYTVRTAIAARAGELAAVRAANHDVLTGLANRRAFMDVLVREEARAQRGGGAPSLIAIDLDGFKPINDTYGHAAGDAALKAIASVLEAECRSYDVVARFGGDEFTLLLPDTTTESAYAVAENVLARIMATPVVPNDEAYRMSASLGVATLFQHAETSEALLESADTALYHVKHRTKRSIAVATRSASVA
jgi:diguanylate cyclase (GGDEF)-like protein